MTLHITGSLAILGDNSLDGNQLGSRPQKLMSNMHELRVGGEERRQECLMPRGAGKGQAAWRREPKDGADLLLIGVEKQEGGNGSNR